MWRDVVGGFRAGATETGPRAERDGANAEGHIASGGRTIAVGQASRGPRSVGTARAEGWANPPSAGAEGEGGENGRKEPPKKN